MNALPTISSPAAPGDVTDPTIVVRLLTIGQVMQQCGLRSTTIYERIKLGTFPAPVKNGTSSRWISTEIDGWIARLIAARDAAPPRVCEGVHA